MTDDTYTVERETTIDAPPERVRALIVDFREWPRWSPWEEVDPGMQRSYSGADSGIGARYAWSGNRKAGQGHMQITEATSSKITIDLAFEKPWKARNDTWFVVEPAGDGSRVRWSMTGKKTLMTRVMGIFKSMEDFLGPDFEKGLSRLKAAAESTTR